MTDVPSPPPQVSIGRVRVSGVDNGTARSLGTAIGRLLEAKVRDGSFSPEGRSSIRLELPHGVSEREIAAALARALGAR
jgi:hypothetical protein